MQVIQVPNSVDPATPLKASIFLAGPCPRDSGVQDWRHECVELFRNKGFDGALFWPVPSKNEEKGEFNLDKQVSWETKHLKMADLILFWMPRHLTKDNGAFAGFTSNVEFGLYHKTGKVVMGHPDWAEKMRYIDWWCEKINALPITNTLEDLVDFCMERLKNFGYQKQQQATNQEEGLVVAEKKVEESRSSASVVERVGGEQYVPLILWRSRAFQSWYQNQLKNNNKLLWADVDYCFQIPNSKGKFYSAFIAILKAHIEIGNENKRVKDNEVVVFRPDVAAVVPFYVAEGDTIKTPQDLFEKVKIVLTSEFRTPCRNSCGNQVVEPPCGSSWEQVDDNKNNDTAFSWKSVALEELHEEADILIKDSEVENRIIYIGSRQVASTLSAHHSHVYAVKLTTEEFEVCKKNAEEKKIFGVEEDTERTSLKILSYGDVVKNDKEDDNGLDWSAVGLISQAMMKVFF